MNRYSQNNRIAATLGLLAIVIVIGAGVAVGTRKTSADDNSAASQTARMPGNTPTATQAPASSVQKSASMLSSTKYKNGTYSASGSYRAPDGTQQIGIRLTISGDSVSAASATNQASGQSAIFEDQFISDFKSQVVGMKVDSISIFTGATLTLLGFDNALAKIESQAKA